MNESFGTHHTIETVRSKQEKLQAKGEALFDTPFMIQSNAESMKKIAFGICLLSSTANLIRFHPN